MLPHSFINTDNSDNITPIFTYFPLLIDGIATDFKFFSSANLRTFLVAVSSCCCELEDPQLGLLTWITYFAGKFFPGQIAAASNMQVIMYMYLEYFGKNFNLQKP